MCNRIHENSIMTKNRFGYKLFEVNANKELCSLVTFSSFINTKRNHIKYGYPEDNTPVMWKGTTSFSRVKRIEGFYYFPVFSAVNGRISRWVEELLDIKIKFHLVLFKIEIPTGLDICTFTENEIPITVGLCSGFSLYEHIFGLKMERHECIE